MTDPHARSRRAADGRTATAGRPNADGRPNAAGRAYAAGRTTSRVVFRLLTVAFALLLIFPEEHAALAQDDPLRDVPQVTKTVAIQNARIVQAPGRVIERGTVVIHDGLIAAVGADVAVPYDAEIIPGDSLTVYAGFIDGLSHVGLTKQDAPERPGNVNAADPPQDYAGIQPDRRARDLLKPDDASIDALRKLGFTAAHVVPQGRMLPGSGSIILLRGDAPSEMVLRPDVSQFMQFAGGPGVYPATSIGVIAKLRQLYRESNRRKRIELLYAENPAGMERPSFDPIHQALYPVLSRERPLFVLADGDDSALEVHRALSLAEELGFSVALTGLAQGFEVVRALQEARVPLFVTLGLPEGEGEADSSAVADTVKAVTPEDPASFFVSDHRTRSFEDVEAEKKNLEARRAIARARYVANAAVLHEAGLRFGVSTLGVESNAIRKNIREMIATGLPEDAALAALTIDGARLLGVDRSLGTVEVGKMANLVVTDGSYFSEDGEIRFVFVEGRKFEVEEEGEEEGSSLDEVAGTWTLEIDAPDGAVEAVVELSVTGGELGGRVTSSELMRPADVSNVSFENDRLTFTINTSEYGDVAASFRVSGNTLTGTVDVPGTGILDVTGKKVPKN